MLRLSHTYRATCTEIQAKYVLCHVDTSPCIPQDVLSDTAQDVCAWLAAEAEYKRYEHSLQLSSFYQVSRRWNNVS